MFGLDFFYDVSRSKLRLVAWENNEGDKVTVVSDEECTILFPATEEDAITVTENMVVYKNKLE